VYNNYFCFVKQSEAASKTSVFGVTCQVHAGEVSKIFEHATELKSLHLASGFEQQRL